MVMQGLATALTDAVRDTKSVSWDAVLKNMQGSKVLQETLFFFLLPLLFRWVRRQAVVVSRVCFWVLDITPQMITVKFIEMVE